MKKDELVQHAKEEFGVELDKKQKLSDLEAQVEVLEKKKPVKETKKSSGKKDPIASKGEYGKSSSMESYPQRRTLDIYL